jgi:hypothetical protein
MKSVIWLVNFKRYQNVGVLWEPLTNRMTDFICCCVLLNNGIHNSRGFVPDWKTWVTAVHLHYVNCSGDSRVEGVHRYLRQSGFMQILSAIVLYTLGVLPLTVRHSKTLVTYFRAKFQVCRGALTSRVKQLWKIMSRRNDKSIC